MKAVASDSPETVEQLLSVEVDANIKDILGNTALINAVNTSSEKIIELARLWSGYKHN